MDFSKVKKLVIPEGEVQSITIDDKVVWTKPQEGSQHTIYNGSARCTFQKYNDLHENLVTFDSTKSKRYRYTFTCDERPQKAYYGENGTQSENNKTSGTYEVTLTSSTSSILLLKGEYKGQESDIWLNTYTDKDGNIHLGCFVYGNTVDYNGWTIRLKVEQFY